MKKPPSTNPTPIDPDDPHLSDALAGALAGALEPLPPASARGAALRSRLLERARASREESGRFITVRRDEGEWRPLVDGVRVKMLNDGAAARSVLVDIEPGGVLPIHRHNEHEECVVLRGEAQLGDLVVREGDYHIALAGSRHGRVSSRSGALLYLRGVPIGHGLEVARDLVKALLPGKGAAPITVRADEGDWRDLVPGVQTKELWCEGGERSMLLRMQAGARVPGHPHPQAEDCLLLEGEAWIGDTLFRSGEYQHAPAGSLHRELTSDVGALMYVHGAADYAPAARL
ncbi:MAG: cupin domain-containing protein [Burkholderiales bacterium]|nr:cupin domain-containing protein [Rhodocyclaceae bacterium]MBP8294835.1 cupin domain-containing protein [Burkholderiales bacterium]HMV54252.1 cupin domain-containing protein [Rhodocyclaceae bacterium]HMZ83643.1 cupin domain-containing protein [Rhodocyclaceae bacterium]HNA04728.1 cupin domain-containing protein [Rhodocyclaceae bacterium]